MEFLYSLLGFDLASTLFTLLEVVRLENSINNVFNSITTTVEDTEEEESGSKPRTFT